MTDPLDDEQRQVQAFQPPPIEALSRVDIDIQIATAKRYPRAAISAIQKKIFDHVRLKDEHSGDTVAESCFYTLPPRGKSEKPIQGPSARLAEIAFQNYGNMAAGARDCANNGEKVTAQGLCWDLENNNRVTWEVDRQILDKNGHIYPLHLQIATANAAKSIAFRNAVLRVVPRALYWPVYEECLRIAAGVSVGHGSSQQMEIKRDKLFKRFAQLGVEPERILSILKKPRVQDVDSDDIILMIGLGTAIRDGDITIQEVLRAAEQQPAQKKQTLKDITENIKAKRANPQEDAPVEEEPS